MSIFKKPLLIFLFVIPFYLKGLSTAKNLDNDTITITQQILPGPNWNYSYLVSSERITIYRTKNLTKSGHTRKRKIYNLKLNPQQSDSLLFIIKQIEIAELKNYSAGWLDGVIWTFNFKCENINMVIELENYYLPEIEELVDFLNRLLPKNKRFISFDIFNIRDKQISN